MTRYGVQEGSCWLNVCGLPLFKVQTITELKINRTWADPKIQMTINECKHVKRWTFLLISLSPVLLSCCSPGGWWGSRWSRWTSWRWGSSCSNRRGAGRGVWWRVSKELDLGISFNKMSSFFISQMRASAAWMSASALAFHTPRLFHRVHPKTAPRSIFIQALSAFKLMLAWDGLVESDIEVALPIVEFEELKPLLFCIRVGAVTSELVNTTRAVNARRR